MPPFLTFFVSLPLVFRKRKFAECCIELMIGRTTGIETGTQVKKGESGRHHFYGDFVSGVSG